MHFFFRRQLAVQHRYRHRCDQGSGRECGGAGQMVRVETVLQPSLAEFFPALTENAFDLPRPACVRGLGWVCWGFRVGLYGVSDLVARGSGFSC